MTELIKLALRAIVSHRLRSVLSMLGIAIGITSVILLTSLGEGTRRYIVNEFAQFGTNILAINPGKAETAGVPGMFGGTTHKLTIDDAEALRRLPEVEDVAPLAFAVARVEGNGRGRSVIIYGTTPDVTEVWKWGPRVGSFWPPGDPRRGSQEVVLGTKVKAELFGDQSPLGKFVKIANSRFRVIGVMEAKGQMLGFDLDDSVFIPVATAMRIFNLDELTEIDLNFFAGIPVSRVEESVQALLTERHDGNDDVTLTSQEQMLDVFGNIMNIVTLAVGAIAGVSLVVGAIGILTMMWIAVGERTNEIGLIRSIGATKKQVQMVFLTEAAALAALGGIFGVLAGLGLCALARTAVPGLPVHTPPEFVVLAIAVSLGTGMVSGVLPARRAAGLDPVEALRAE
ncbi:MAG: ABC transporter permease [Acidobacteriota bacterium]|nr:ABC transporter permease [Acidobacteriota bacterium]